MKNIKICLLVASALAVQSVHAADSVAIIKQAIDTMIRDGYGRSDLFAGAQANIKAGAETRMSTFVSQKDKSLMQASNDLGDLQSELTGNIYTVSQNINKEQSAQYLPDYLQEIKTTLGKLNSMRISGASEAQVVLDYYRKQLAVVAQKAITQLGAKLKGATKSSNKLPFSNKPLPTPSAKGGSRPPQKPVPQIPAAKEQVDTRSAVFGGAATRDSMAKLAQPTPKPTLGQRIKGFFVRGK